MYSRTFSLLLCVILYIGVVTTVCGIATVLVPSDYITTKLVEQVRLDTQIPEKYRDEIIKKLKANLRKFFSRDANTAKSDLATISIIGTLIDEMVYVGYLADALLECEHYIEQLLVYLIFGTLDKNEIKEIKDSKIICNLYRYHEQVIVDCISILHCTLFCSKIISDGKNNRVPKEKMFLRITNKENDSKFESKKHDVIYGEEILELKKTNDITNSANGVKLFETAVEGILFGLNDLSVLANKHIDIDIQSLSYKGDEPFFLFECWEQLMEEDTQKIKDSEFVVLESYSLAVCKLEKCWNMWNKLIDKVKVDESLYFEPKYPFAVKVWTEIQKKGCDINASQNDDWEFITYPPFSPTEKQKIIEQKENVLEVPAEIQKKIDMLEAFKKSWFTNSVAKIFACVLLGGKYAESVGFSGEKKTNVIDQLSTLYRFGKPLKSTNTNADTLSVEVSCKKGLELTDSTMLQKNVESLCIQFISELYDLAMISWKKSSAEVTFLVQLLFEPSMETQSTSSQNNRSGGFSEYQMFLRALPSLREAKKKTGYDQLSGLDINATISTQVSDEQEMQKTLQEREWCLKEVSEALYDVVVCLASITDVQWDKKSFQKSLIKQKMVTNMTKFEKQVIKGCQTLELHDFDRENKKATVLLSILKHSNLSKIEYTLGCEGPSEPSFFKVAQRNYIVCEWLLGKY